MNLLLPIDKDLVSKVVCEHFGLPLSELKSSRRTEAIAKPRQVVFYILQKLRQSSCSSIARAFGKDVGTVNWGITSVSELISVDARFAQTVNALLEQCRKEMQ
jgi:chromosomal replication initiator protein